MSTVASALPTPVHARPRKWTPARTAIFLLYIAVIIYSVIPLAMHTGLFDDIVLRPFPGTEPEFKQGAWVEGIKGEPVSIKAADGSEMFAWYFKNTGNKLVIYHHGNAGNIAHRVPLCAGIIQSGASLLLYDYRGFGLSKGRQSVSKLLPDGLAVYDYARTTLKYEAKDIINYGESIGAGVATGVAAARPSAGLITVAGVGSLPSVGHFHFGFLRPYPDFLFPEPRFDNVDKIRQVHVPVLVFHGAKDTLVPLEQGRAIYRNANEPKNLVILPNAGHNDIGTDWKTYHTALVSFIAGLK